MVSCEVCCELPGVWLSWFRKTWTFERCSNRDMFTQGIVASFVFQQLGVLSFWERWKVFFANCRKETCSIAPKLTTQFTENDNFNYFCLKNQRPKMFFWFDTLLPFHFLVLFWCPQERLTYFNCGGVYFKQVTQVTGISWGKSPWTLGFDKPKWSQLPWSNSTWNHQFSELIFQIKWLETATSLKFPTILIKSIVDIVTLSIYFLGIKI